MTDAADLCLSILVLVVAALVAPLPCNRVRLTFGWEEHYGGGCEHRDVSLVTCSVSRCIVLYESEPTKCRRTP